MTTSPDAHSYEDDPIITAQPGDARAVLIYLVAPGSDQYVAIMDVLEASVTDLTPREVVARLQAAGTGLGDEVVEARLDKLREWGAVSARTDTSRILRHADLLARNWRYTATTAGRHVQRFYRKVLAGTPTVREIPLSSLARVVETAESLASTLQMGPGTADAIGKLFVSHDDLDAALVGAEDSLAGLADRFDLNDASTAELKALLVGYATHVASELERGSARAFRALGALRSRFAELAATAVSASDARTLIERGALAASRGGRVEDWGGCWRGSIQTPADRHDSPYASFVRSRGCISTCAGCTAPPGPLPAEFVRWLSPGPARTRRSVPQSG
jgi:hypothetical protein